MDICVEPNSRQCFKVQPPVYDKFNVIYYKDESLTLLWNKYEILLYEGEAYTGEQLRFSPEFVIQNVMISNNYLVCLDTNCTVSTTRLKSKNQQKRHKSSFLPVQRNVTHTFQHNKEQCLCIMYESRWFLTINKLNADFECLKKITMVFSDQIQLTAPQRCLMAAYTILDNKLSHLNTIFQLPTHQSNSCLVALSLDSQTVYACIINSSTEETVPVYLYKCPTEINGIEIIDMDSPEIIIGLKTGTLIRMVINNNLEPPQIVHLNTAIHKFKAVKHMVLYTDGCTMWKVDNTFADNPKFTQLFVKQVKDFATTFNNQIICVTYSNFIYKFELEASIQTETSYLPAEKLSDSGLLEKIIEEIDKNDRIVQKLKTELNYVSALALSNRTDLRHQLAEYFVTVYENYQHLEQNTKISLTDKIYEYFETNSIIFQIKIMLTKQWKVIEVFNTLLGKMRLHITFSNKSRVLKTTSILLTEILNEAYILVPLKYENYSELNLEFTLMAEVPGGLDVDTELSIILSKKTATISSENFIKSFQNNIFEMNSQKQDVILASALNLNSDYFKITQGLKELNEYYFYCYLPENFAEILKTKESYTKHLNEHQALFLYKKFTAEHYLNEKTTIILQVGESKVKLALGFNDYGLHIMKFQGHDVKVVNNLRNYFARMLYSGIEKDSERKVIVPKIQHVLLRDMEQSLKDSIAAGCHNFSEMLKMTDTFNSHIISSLPL